MAEKSADMQVEGVRKGEERDGEQEPEQSPSKRRDGGELTVASLQRLLQQQTKEIKEQTQSDIQKAVARLEESTDKKIGMIREEFNTLKHAVSQQGSQMDDSKREQNSLSARIAQLESKGSVASTTLGESERKLVIIVGGWHNDTQRDELLKKIDEAINGLDIRSQLDADPVCPGLRRGFGILNLEARQGETAKDTRERMVSVITTINGAKTTNYGVMEGKTMWAGAGKNPQERQRASHASKTRKLMHTLASQLFAHAECEYATGSVWIRGTMVSSATRPRPREGHVVEGKNLQSWLDVGKFAELGPLSASQVEERWRAFMSK